MCDLMSLLLLTYVYETTKQGSPYCGVPPDTSGTYWSDKGSVHGAPYMG